MSRKMSRKRFNGGDFAHRAGESGFILRMLSRIDLWSIRSAGMSL